MKLRDAFSGNQLFNDTEGRIDTEFLRKFIGYSTNASWMTDAEFLQCVRTESTVPKVDAAFQRRASKFIQEAWKSHQANVRSQPIPETKPEAPVDAVGV